MADVEVLQVVSDIDDVQAATIPTMIDSANRWFNRRLTLVDYTENLLKMLGVTREAAQPWFDHFCEIEMPDLPCVEGMPEVFARLPAGVEVVDLTGRKPKYAQLTKAWVSEHYPRTIDVRHSSADWDNDPKAHLHTKAADISDSPPHVLLDNEVKHALSVAALGTEVGLVDLYPAQQLAVPQLPPNVTHLTSPALVEEFILEQYGRLAA